MSNESHRAADACESLVHESATLLESQRQHRIAQDRANAEATAANAPAEAMARAQDELMDARKTLAANEDLLATRTALIKETDRSRNERRTSSSAKKRRKRSSARSIASGCRQLIWNKKSPCIQISFRTKPFR